MKRFTTFLTEAKAIFSKDLEVYHGTNREFDRFSDNPKRQSYTPEHEVTGHFFTSDPMQASSYAAQAKRKSNGEGRTRVVRATLDLHNPKDITSEIKKHRKAGLSFGEAKKKAHATVDRSVHDGTVFHGDGMNPSEYVAFSAHSIKMK